LFIKNKTKNERINILNVLFTLLATMCGVYLAQLINTVGTSTIMNSIAWFIPGILFVYTIYCGIYTFQDDDY